MQKDVGANHLFVKNEDSSFSFFYPHSSAQSSRWRCQYSDPQQYISVVLFNKSEEETRWLILGGHLHKPKKQVTKLEHVASIVSGVSWCRETTQMGNALEGMRWRGKSHLPSLFPNVSLEVSFFLLFKAACFWCFGSTTHVQYQRIFPYGCRIGCCDDRDQTMKNRNKII